MENIYRILNKVIKIYGQSDSYITMIGETRKDNRGRNYDEYYLCNITSRTKKEAIQWALENVGYQSLFN